MELALGIALIVLSVALTLMILFQSAKDSRLSGTIAGGAETFFGKNKNSAFEAKMALGTKVSAAVFIVLALLMVIIG